MDTSDTNGGHSEALTPRLRPHPLAVAHNPNQEYRQTEDEGSTVDDYASLADHRGYARSPPLLMPPPRGRLEELQDRTELAAFYVFSLVGIEHDLLNHALRMGLFIVKLTTLAQPCWPYMVKLEVAIPLIFIGVMDLRVPHASDSPLARRNQRGEVEFGPPRMRGLMWSLVLIGFHAAVLWLARGWNSLCVTHALKDWEQW